MSNPLLIESLAYKGDGVAHLEDGRVAFIPNTAPGDFVSADIVHEGDGFARMKLTEVLKPSPNRISPPCPYAELCGGCQWQHIAYEEQLRWKRRSVIDAFERIGKIENAETLVGECVPSPKQLHYRNKVEFTVSRDQNGRLALGLHSNMNNEVEPIQIKECLLLPKKFAGAPKAIQGTLRYLQGADDLGITRVGLRASTKTSSSELALWTPPSSFPRPMTVKSFSTSLPVKSITRVLYKGKLKERKISKVEVFTGKGFWEERLNGNTFMVSAPSFFQVNSSAAEKLVSHAVSLLEAQGSERTLDLYSGVGTFTLELAKHVEDVVAVESVGSSISDLRRNLDAACLHADVIGGDTSRELDSFAHAGIDAVIVDPPRSGLAKEVPSKIAATNAEKIVYVSCDPTTLARDLNAFTQLGYRVETVTPFDLFPQTYHVESVVLLSKA